tara:strand:- start:574 stop:816 length:243 start_codon:yes stop_codon:yes gene_type:complete
MPRSKSSKNTHYHFEVIVDEEKKMCRTVIEVAKALEVSQATIVRKLREPDIVLNKYKNKSLLINRVNVPIFKQVPQMIEY